MTFNVKNPILTDLALMEKHLEKMSTELSQCYEQIMLLYNLSTHMNLDQSNATYLQLACDQLTQLIPVEGIAIFSGKENRRR